MSDDLTNCPYETFPALASLPVIHAFTNTVPGLEVRTDRATALARLDTFHDRVRSALGLEKRHWVTARQVHGADVAVVNASTPSPVPAVDALITNDPGVCLGIYVADCGPVWLVDPVRRAIGCIHSGRKGTDLGVVPAAIAAMQRAFGSKPSDIVAQLGPCIRPPHYEIDFAASIVRQCREAGLLEVHDCQSCTASAPTRYYSYRSEKGQTGRMLAILALA
jgi:copper oxidase (laccase) domain-containing protein